MVSLRGHFYYMPYFVLFDSLKLEFKILISQKISVVVSGMDISIQYSFEHSNINVKGSNKQTHSPNWMSSMLVTDIIQGIQDNEHHFVYYLS